MHCDLIHTFQYDDLSLRNLNLNLTVTVKLFEM